jgi:hypothetical protein
MNHVRSKSKGEYIPPLENGDRLTREEFERRYNAMPHVKKAELINGVVYIVAAENPNGVPGMSSPVNPTRHGSPHLLLGIWVGSYYVSTPGTHGSDNGTLRFPSNRSVVQPDLFLRILPECGGQTRTLKGGWVQGAPELAIEITASRANYDLHDKLDAYQRDGVREYIVWRVEEDAIDWFILRRQTYEQLPPARDGILRSESFPGLWLDATAMIRGDHAEWKKVLQDGLASPEHADFVARLQRRRTRKKR